MKAAKLSLQEPITKIMLMMLLALLLVASACVRPASSTVIDLRSVDLGHVDRFDKGIVFTFTIPGDLNMLLPQIGVPEVEEKFRISTIRFYVVNHETEGFLALWSRDPHLGCFVPWRDHLEEPVFKNPCHGEVYNKAGVCLEGPCVRGLDRFPVTIRGGRVLVDLTTVIEGPPTAAPMLTPTPTPMPQPPNLKGLPVARVTLARDLSRSQYGELGTYCWTWERSNFGMCVDAIGIIIPAEPLELFPGETLTFTLSGPEPDELLLRIAVLDTTKPLIPANGGEAMIVTYNAVLVDSITIPEPGLEFNYATSLAPGAYVISLSGYWPQGDANYGFHIRVVKGE